MLIRAVLRTERIRHNFTFFSRKNNMYIKAYSANLGRVRLLIFFMKRESFKVTVTVYYKPAVKASVKDGMITLEWDDVPNAEKYCVYTMKNGRSKLLKETDKSNLRIKGKSRICSRGCCKRRTDGSIEVRSCKRNS